MGSLAHADEVADAFGAPSDRSAAWPDGRNATLSAPDRCASSLVRNGNRHPSFRVILRRVEVGPVSRAMRTPLAFAVVALGGCAQDGANEGDCNAKIRFQGSIYRVHSDMRDHAPLGRSVGQGEVVGCGGLEAPAIDEVQVRRIKGVSPAVALATDDEDWGVGSSSGRTWRRGRPPGPRSLCREPSRLEATSFPVWAVSR